MPDQPRKQELGRIRTTATIWLPLAVTLLALMLRLWRWDAQSLWLDEAMSWWWSQLPPLETLTRGLQLAGDPHPPLYYLALHAWSTCFGDGEGALKAFSIAAGTLLVLPVYGLGRRLFSPAVGLIAALLVAVNPFLIWYSQEVRMYALLGLLTTSATYALWRGLTPPSPTSSPMGSEERRFGVGLAWGSKPQAEQVEGRFQRPGSSRSRSPLEAGLNLAQPDDLSSGDPRSKKPILEGRREWGRWAWWLLYLLLTVAGLYTHFYAALLLPFHVLFVLLFWRAHRRALVPALVAWTMAGLAYLPWALRAWQVSGTSLDTIRTSLPEMVLALWPGWSLRAVPDQGVILALLLAPFAVLFLLGLVPRRGEGRALAFPVLWLLVPLLAIEVLSRRDPIFGVQYAIAFAPAFYLLLARGVVTVYRLMQRVNWSHSHRLGIAAAAVALAAVLAASLYGLGQNANPLYRKEDWRSLARYVREHEGPHDAVLCIADYARIPFEFYYSDGRSPVFHPFGTAIESEEAIAPTLVGLTVYDTVWLVESHEQVVDPNHIVRGHLGRQWPIVTEQFPVGAQLRGYAVRYRLDELPARATPLDVTFDGRLRLAGFRVDATRLRPTDDAFHPPSNWIHVTLYWQPLARLDADYDVRLELSGNGIWGGDLERPTQVMRFYPSSQWATGEIVRDEADVNLNPATPPGTYRLAVRVARPDGAFLSLPDGLDYVLLPGEIDITP